MRQRFGRVVQAFERMPQLPDRHATLCPDQPSTQHGGQHYNRQGWPDANQATKLNEQGDFDDRNHQKGQK